MQLRYYLLLISVMILAGCSAPRAVVPGASPQAVADASPRAPVQQGPDPVSTGRQLLEAGGRRWLDDPVAVVVQQMTYAEAHNWIPMLSEEGDKFWGSQTSVWLVIFKGAWIPNDPAQANPQPVTYPGCLLVLFRAADGTLIAAGDSLCPGQQ